MDKRNVALVVLTAVMLTLVSILVVVIEDISAKNTEIASLKMDRDVAVQVVAVQGDKIKSLEINFDVARAVIAAQSEIVARQVETIAAKDAVIEAKDAEVVGLQDQLEDAVQSAQESFESFAKMANDLKDAKKRLASANTIAGRFSRHLKDLGYSKEQINTIRYHGRGVGTPAVSTVQTVQTVSTSSSPSTATENPKLVTLTSTAPASVGVETGVVPEVSRLRNENVKLKIALQDAEKRNEELSLQFVTTKTELDGKVVELTKLLDQMKHQLDQVERLQEELERKANKCGQVKPKQSPLRRGLITTAETKDSDPVDHEPVIRETNTNTQSRSTPVDSGKPHKGKKAVSSPLHSFQNSDTNHNLQPAQERVWRSRIRPAVPDGKDSSLNIQTQHRTEDACIRGSRDHPPPGSAPFGQEQEVNLAHATIPS